MKELSTALAEATTPDIEHAVLNQIGALLADRAVDVSAYEMRGSGLVVSLLRYLSEEPSEMKDVAIETGSGKGVATARPRLERLALFSAVFMTGVSEVPVFSVLLNVLQGVLNRYVMSSSYNWHIYTHLFISIPIFSYLYPSFHIYTHLFISIPIFSYLYPSFHIYT